MTSLAVPRYDSVLVCRRVVRGVDSACASTTLVTEGLASTQLPWDDSRSELDNYLTAVRRLLDRRSKTHVTIVAIARLPQSTLNGAPHAFLLSESL